MARLPHDEREKSIIQAARIAFSENGFNGTSIKDIAKAADMSPALLYAYFESKSALYDAVLESTRDNVRPVINEMKRMGPGPEALVLCVYDTYFSELFCPEQYLEERRAFDRLFCRSLVGTRDFASQHHDELERLLGDDIVISSIHVSEEMGAMFPVKETAQAKIQFMLHQILALKLSFLSDPPLYHYDMSRRELMDGLMSFSLRGMGFTPEAFDRYYDFDRLMSATLRVHEASSV